MILQTSIDFQINNIIHSIIKRSNIDISGVRSTKDLKLKYHEYLFIIQNRIIKYNEKTTIVSHRDDAIKLKNIFEGIGESKLDDLDQNNVICLENIDENISKKEELLYSAMDKIKYLSKEHYELLNIIISEIFILPSKNATGGSSSESIGLIWGNPKKEHHVIDVVEFLIHELTHNCMFMDEHNHQHYKYENILKKENFAISAILKKPRPIDKVLHSIIVGIEIILFRENFIGHPNSPKMHPPSNILIQQLNKSLDSLDDLIRLKNKDLLLTDRSLHLLDNSRKILSSMQFK